MSINSVLVTALTPITTAIEPDVYKGSATEYFTFNYETSGDEFADNTPQHERYLMQVHYCCPSEKNSLANRVLIKQYLLAAGFTWPRVTPASDEKGQHWVFECEYLGAV